MIPNDKNVLTGKTALRSVVCSLKGNVIPFHPQENIKQIITDQNNYNNS
jgi:hypothetical protein